MKKLVMSISIIILLLVLAISYITACTQTGTGKGDFKISLTEGTAGSAIAYELATGTFPTETKMMIYKVKNQSVTANSVQKIGASIGFTGSAGLIDGDTKFAMLEETKDEVKQLSVCLNSGAIEYAIVYPDKLYPPTPPDLPSNEEAKAIAIDFLQQSSLWPSDARQSDVEAVVGGTFQVIDTSSGQAEVIEEYDTHLLVRVDCYLDSYQVIGPGAKLGVRIGDEGEVIRVLKCWRETEPYKEMEIKTPMEAYEELKSGMGTSIAPVECQTVVITEVLLAYWMNPIDETQELVLPVYVFKGECLNADGNVVAQYEGYCKAWVE